MYVNMYLYFDLFFPKCFSDHQANAAVPNAIVYCECFPYEFGFNNICWLETLKNPATSQVEGDNNVFQKMQWKAKRCQ